MSDFGTVTFDRIKEQYADVDVGANALYAVIAQLIQEGYEDTALDLAMEASRIYTAGDSFIEDDVTSHTDVFLEVFRRTLFVPEPALADREDWRLQITSTASYLGNFRMFIIAQAR